MGILFEMQVGWNTPTSSTFKVSSTWGSRDAVLGIPGVNTHADMWLVFSSVKCEVSPKAFFWGEKKKRSFGVIFTLQIHSVYVCRMEDSVLQMDSATQKHLSPLLIILISWNYNGKCKTLVVL